MELSVVLPMLNEAENIRDLLHEIVTSLNGKVAFEIVAVDDGSDDGTFACLQAAANDIPQLRCLQHRRAFGQSMAIFTGVHAARGEWIATLDSDGQNDPADIVGLFEAAKQHAHLRQPVLIAGNRTRRNDSWLRRWSSRVANQVRQALLRDQCTDTGCALKVFKREVFLAFPHFNHMHRFLPALIIRAGGKVINQSVNHRSRMGGASKYGVWNRLWVGIVDLFGVAWLQRRPCLPEVVNESE